MIFHNSYDIYYIITYLYNLNKYKIIICRFVYLEQFQTRFQIFNKNKNKNSQQYI